MLEDNLMKHSCDTPLAVWKGVIVDDITAMRPATSILSLKIPFCAHSELDQAEYQRQYDEYAVRFEVTRRRINEVSEQREALIAKRGRLQSCLDTLKRQELIAEFDEVLWHGTVDQVRVKQDGKLRFIFKDETEIEV